MAALASVGVVRVRDYLTCVISDDLRQSVVALLDYFRLLITISHLLVFDEHLVPHLQVILFRF